MPGPFFISFEGGEGAGKTTQAEILSKTLENLHIGSVLFREPGSTPLGRHLRNYLKGMQPLTKEAELLLFEAARAELVREKIKPSLDQGLTVIADRFEASTIAYQGYGRGIDIEIIKNLNNFATQGIYPDVTFLLDLAPEQGLMRTGGIQLSLPLGFEEPVEYVRRDIEGRRFEDLALRFHERIRTGYLHLAEQDPDRWIVIDATLPESLISHQVLHHVSERLGIPSNHATK